MFIYREINEWVTLCVHQDSSKAVSLGLWMEEMIFNLADSRLFFNDLEVSRFITWATSVSNRCWVLFPLQLECFLSIYFSHKAFYCVELHNLPLVATFSPIAPWIQGRLKVNVYRLPFQSRLWSLAQWKDIFHIVYIEVRTNQVVILGHFMRLAALFQSLWVLNFQNMSSEPVN